MIQSFLSLLKFVNSGVTEPDKRVQGRLKMLADGIVIDLIVVVELEGVKISLQCRLVFFRRLMLIFLDRSSFTVLILFLISSSKEFFIYLLIEII